MNRPAFALAIALFVGLAITLLLVLMEPEILDAIDDFISWRSGRNA